MWGNIVLTKQFEEIYRTFRLQLYKDIFGILKEREGSLSATEYFAAEVVFLLGSPTISQFAEFLNVSSSHAAYKVKTLIDKGYINKLPTSDGRTFKLTVTEKFSRFYHEEDYYGNYVMKKVSAKLSKEQEKQLTELLDMIIKTGTLQKGEK